MDTDATEAEMIVRLKRLEAAYGVSAPAFGYDAMIEQHAAKKTRARRRHVLARGTASALVVALVAASVWRLDQPPAATPVVDTATTVVEARTSQPRLVRADNHLGIAALEDHIASYDDALTEARVRGGSDDVERLERTRAELLDSYAQVRYAQMVSANF